MPSLIIYGSEDCLGWEDTLEVVEKLKSDPEFGFPVEIRSPENHEQAFRELGAVICPAYVFEDEVISVGPTDHDYIKRSIRSDETP